MKERDLGLSLSDFLLSYVNCVKNRTFAMRFALYLVCDACFGPVAEFGFIRVVDWKCWPAWLFSQCTGSTRTSIDDVD